MNKPLPPITMTPCKSSSITAHGYCPDTNRLAITFKDGQTYHYHDVPKHVADKLAGAESIGKFVSANVVGKYKHSKV